MPTYYADVKPILDGRCVPCHSETGVAPFGLGTYEDAAEYGQAIVAATSSRTMPPWPAAAGCNTYTHDPSLSPDQLEILQAWVDADAPPGDPADEGEPLSPLGVELPRVDFDVTMTEAHTPQPEPDGHDEHRCFLLDWPSTEDTFITGFEVVPGNRRVVHHLVARVVDGEALAELEAADATDPGYGWTCGPGSGMTGRQGAMLGVWVPGRGATVFPEDTGLPAPTGSKVLLNMHYNTAMGDASPDRTGIEFMVEPDVARPGRTISVVDPAWLIGDNMLIPAGEANVVHEVDFGLEEFDSALDLYEVTMHMHTFGSATNLWIERADGSQDCLVDIPAWDFDWQLGYAIEGGVRVEQGDRIHLSCTFDNSEANQPIIHGMPREPVDVTWGEDTYDEMCTAFVFTVRAE